MNENKLIEKLHENGIWLQDTLSVLYDLRPCMRYSLTKNRYTLLKTILPHLGLKMIIYIYKDINKPMCVISKDESILKKIYLYDNNTLSTEKVGRLLGYPDCCIKFFRSKHDKKLLPLKTKENTKTKIDYKLNYLFNFDSRIKTEDINYVDRLYQNKYQCWNKYLIPHMPCSFDCKPSMEYASKLFSMIEKEFPEYAKELKLYLSSPILFINDYEFMVFEGKVLENNTIQYKNLLRVNNLIDKKIFDIISQGNELKLLENEISVLKNGKEIKELKIKAEIFDFVE